MWIEDHVNNPFHDTRRYGTAHDDIACIGTRADAFIKRASIADQQTQDLPSPLFLFQRLDMSESDFPIN